jgi:hypothetical protein
MPALTRAAHGTGGEQLLDPIERCPVGERFVASLVLDAGRRIELVDRPTPLQRKILDALSVDTSTWNRAAIA